MTISWLTYCLKIPLKTTWTCPKNRWRTEKMNNKTLAKAIESEIHSYAKENLAIINIFIKEPSLKRFRKTEKMSRISYIASSGGLLGRVCERLSCKKSKKMVYIRYCMHTIINRSWNILNSLFEGQKHLLGGFNGLKK